MSSKNAGLIGLGAMGSGMARSLRRAGYQVHVFDVRREAADAFAKDGGVACASPAEVAAACEVVFSVVVNAEQTETVLFGKAGAGSAAVGSAGTSGAGAAGTATSGAAAAMKPGSVFIMCSTVPPAFAISLEARLEAIGLLFLDAPISGGAARAASAEMTMMSAGKPAVYAKCEAMLNAVAAKVYKLGDKAGNGSKVKIINQLLAGVHIAAAAEAMALGIREGVAPEDLYEVITHSAGNSWMFENRMAHVLANDYTPLSAIDIFVKDLGLVLDTARASKFPLPLSATAHQMFMQASTAGYAKEDDAAVIKIFPGIKLPEGNK